MKQSALKPHTSGYYSLLFTRCCLALDGLWEVWSRILIGIFFRWGRVKLEEFPAMKKTSLTGRTGQTCGTTRGQHLLITTHRQLPHRCKNAPIVLTIRGHGGSQNTVITCFIQQSGKIPVDLDQGCSSLVLESPCPVCFRCFPDPAHLIQMNGLL